ncbi:SRPBCC domain-containing protein [Paenibacillus sp. CC-CFT747]|nr:SRPBCC domain-containing protein [Paenibacillus sp. CC-CFT747]
MTPPAPQSSGKPVGLTASAGYQIGVRRTLPLSPEKAWTSLTSREGLRLWLGDWPEPQVAAGVRYETREGHTGEFRIVKPGQQLRLTWQPKHWAAPSTVQIRLLSSHPEKTTISFHQEKLADAEARDAMKRHWEEALAALAAGE